jgi:hypothetical protein
MTDHDRPEHPGTKANMSGDGLHPNVNGYKKLCENMMRQAFALLQAISGLRVKRHMSASGCAFLAACRAMRRVAHAGRQADPEIAAF